MSKQIKLLETAIEKDVDEALSGQLVISNVEADALKKLSTDELKKLLEVRKSLESGIGVRALDGNGVLSF